jgi:hypothetical protein
VCCYIADSGDAAMMVLEGDYVVELGSSVTANLQPELVVHTERERELSASLAWLNRPSCMQRASCCCMLYAAGHQKEREQVKVRTGFCGLVVVVLTGRLHTSLSYKV